MPTVLSKCRKATAKSSQESSNPEHETSVSCPSSQFDLECNLNYKGYEKDLSLKLKGRNWKRNVELRQWTKITKEEVYIVEDDVIFSDLRNDIRKDQPNNKALQEIHLLRQLVRERQHMGWKRSTIEYLEKTPGLKERKIGVQHLENLLRQYGKDKSKTKLSRRNKIDAELQGDSPSKKTISKIRDWVAKPIATELHQARDSAEDTIKDVGETIKETLTGMRDDLGKATTCMEAIFKDLHGDIKDILEPIKKMLDKTKDWRKHLVSQVAFNIHDLYLILRMISLEETWYLAALAIGPIILQWSLGPVLTTVCMSLAAVLYYTWHAKKGEAVDAERQGFLEDNIISRMIVFIGALLGIKSNMMHVRETTMLMAGLNSMRNLGKSILDVAISLIKILSDWFGRETPDEKVKKDIKKRVDIWINRATNWLKRGKADVKTTLSNVKEVKSIAVESYGLLQEIANYDVLPKNKSTIFQRIARMFNEFAIEADSVLNRRMKRQRPICVFFHGPSRQGKTSAMEHLQRDFINAIRPETPYDAMQDHFSKSNKDNFYSGYSSQPVFEYDDILQTNEACKAYEFIDEIIQLNNVNPMIANMAGLEEKGCTYLEPKLITGTTNVDFLYGSGEKKMPVNLERLMADVDAMKNRIDVYCRVVVKDEFRKDNRISEELIDKAGMTNNPRICSYRTYTIHDFKTGPRTSTKEKPEYIDYSYDDILDWCVMEYRRREILHLEQVEDYLLKVTELPKTRVYSTEGFLIDYYPDKATGVHSILVKNRELVAKRMGSAITAATRERASEIALTIWEEASTYFATENLQSGCISKKKDQCLKFLSTMKNKATTNITDIWNEIKEYTAPEVVYECEIPHERQLVWYGYGLDVCEYVTCVHCKNVKIDYAWKHPHMFEIIHVDGSRVNVGDCEKNYVQQVVSLGLEIKTKEKVFNFIRRILSLILDVCKDNKYKLAALATAGAGIAGLIQLDKSRRDVDYVDIVNRRIVKKSQLEDYTTAGMETNLQYYDPSEVPSDTPEKLQQQLMFERMLEQSKASSKQHKTRGGGNIHNRNFDRSGAAFALRQADSSYADSIVDNCGRIEVEGRSFPILYLGNKMFMSVAHAIEQLFDVRHEAIYTISGRLGSKTINHHPQKSCWLVNSHTDTVYFMDALVPDYRSLISRFMRESDLPKFSCTVGQNKTLVTATRIEITPSGVVDRNTGMIERVVPSLRLANCPDYVIDMGVCYDSDNRAGCCGSVVIQSNPTLPAILGLHIAGNVQYAKCYASIVTRELIEEIQSMMFVSDDAILAEKQGYDTEEELLADTRYEFVHSDYQTVAKERETVVELYNFLSPHTDVEVIPPNARIRMPSDSKLERAPLYGLYSTETQPAILRPYRIFDEFGIRMESPVNVGVKKSFKGCSRFKQKDIDQAKELVRFKLFSNARKKIYPGKVLTVDEAVNGRPLDNYIKSIDMTTSAGYPFNRKDLYPHLDNSKRCLFNRDSSDLYIMTPLMQREYTRTIDALIKGSDPGLDFTDTLKDEKLPVGKNARLFSAGSVVGTIIGRQYYGMAAAAIMEQHSCNEVSVGVAPTIGDWTALWKYLESVDSNCKYIAGDYSAFDRTLEANLLEAAFDILDSYYDMEGPEQLKIRWNYRQSIVRAWHRCGALRYRAQWGNPSGNPLTTIINSICNSMMMRIIFKRAGNDMREFDNHVRMISFGDDHVLTVSPDVTNFNMKSIARIFKQYNVTYTTTDKKTNFEREFIPLDEVTYLKRYFHIVDVDQLSRSKIAVPRLMLDSIDEMFNWRKRSDTRDVDYLLTINQALYEYSLWGQEEFNTRHRLIARMAASHDLTLLPTDYHYGQRLLGATDLEWKQISDIKRYASPAGGWLLSDEETD